MSSLKRKAAPGGAPRAKAAKTSKDGKPSKRIDRARDSRKHAATAQDDDEELSGKLSGPPAEPIITRTRDEEPMFPRGGGSILTPLEKKQIHIQAKADALREDELEEEGKTKAKAKKQKKLAAAKKPGKGSKKPEAPAKEPSVKIESLSFKTLVKGSLVLCQVVEINVLDLVVALPNNLTGYVPITSISDSLSARLQDKMDDSASEDGEEDPEVDLNALFKIGQYLRAYVVSTLEDASSGKPKRRIELSLKPSEANSGLSADDVVKNCTVMASIVSVEDHGCVMDLGIPGTGAFLPKKEISAAFNTDNLQQGAVFLCLSTGKGGNGKVVQLSIQPGKLGKIKNVPSEATTINTLLPGTAVDVLVVEIPNAGLVGKVMGHMDVTADLIHSGVGGDCVDLDERYKVGSRVKARVICNFANSDEPKLGISLLPHLTGLQSKLSKGDAEDEVAEAPLDRLPISSLVEKCAVRHVANDIGLFVDVGVPGVPGFVHISRVKDGKVDALYETSGPFQLESVHRGRVTGYNPMDGLFLVSFEQRILDQAYLRVEDVPIGEVVPCVVEKLIIGGDGVSGLIVNFVHASDISGFVPAMHLADVHLQHPEKKFREGMKVKARVLSTDRARHRILLTLKKTLVNSETAPVRSLDEAKVGAQMLGWIVKIMPKGAVVKSYGGVTAFLPISEMSEAYISDPNEHFRVGQVVNVHVIDVVPETRRLVVSCKDPAAFGLEKQAALKELPIGSLVSAKVTQKTEEGVLLELGNGLKATLPLGHLSDASLTESEHALKKIKVGSTLSPLMVFSKDEQRRSIVVSRKPSFVEAAKADKLVTSLEDLQVDQEARAVVDNVATGGISIHFPGGIRAWLRKSNLPLSSRKEKNFGFHRHQTILVRVISINRDSDDVLVALVDEQYRKAADLAVNPIDTTIVTVDDAKLGRITKAQVVSVQETQLTVKLADNIPGRIDVSQIFDSWDEIPDAQEPLKKFHPNEVIRVRIIGVHNARKHNFLAISHRATSAILELSAKPSDLAAESVDLLTYHKLEPGSKHIAFVNNIASGGLWVHLTPNVRGRIRASEASDNLSKVASLEQNFPIGCALKVRVISVDPLAPKLHLSARSEMQEESVSWDSLKQNNTLQGRVTKVNDRQVMVKLSESVAGPVHLPDLCDDYDEVDTTKYSKNDIIRVSIVEVDKSNKRVRLSSRPSRVLSSKSPVKDREITSVSQLSAGDLVRGFVKNVAPAGLFVSLGGQVAARVRISNLSDDFIKNWKDSFQVDQLVKGRIVSISKDLGQVELSLRASHLKETWVSSWTYDSITTGQIVTGKVRKVQEYGAFITVDNSDNVSGLCHRSEMAENPVSDATKLYKEGDVVKAKVLSVDPTKKRISFGLKPSYFEADEDADADMDGVDGGANGAASDDDDDDDSDMSVDGGATLVIRGTDNDHSDGEDEPEDVEMTEGALEGLTLGGKYDWTADPFDDAADDGPKVSGKKEEKKRKKSEYQPDRTGELDVHGPQTATDFERLLLGQPDSSSLWIQYIALQMQVSELAKAREIAERAIKTISIREETEKLNVWIAYLNLEVAYGTKATVDEVFARASQHNDEQEVYERLASIYIQTGKHKDAEGLFQTLTKKFGSKTPAVWSNYAHFLHVTIAAPERARELLPRAMQALDKHHHNPLITKFAALEFHSPNGDAERGRTIFEGVLSTYPKKFDLWNQLLDLEIGATAAAAASGSSSGAEASEAASAVRDVFERGAKVKGLKPRQAEKWFRRWSEWEGAIDPKGRERVMARAQEWAAKRKAAAAEVEAETGDGE